MGVDIPNQTGWYFFSLHIFSTAIPFLVEFLSLEVSSSERNASFMFSFCAIFRLISSISLLDFNQTASPEFHL